MTASRTHALDEHETNLVEQSRDVADRPDRELTDLVKLLRARRDRIQRMIRARSRSASREGKDNIDAGARDKKRLLVEALDRTTAELSRRRAGGKNGSAATDNLRDAVRRKAESPSWTGPEDRTANPGPAETPNRRIAPSGALHAEGMRAAIARSTGDR
ncbi:hypothetical protein GCM10009422_14670 [Brevundimonas kwangchunensis]|uniref:Uncharacterized protein n=1 Tax=Brevundimonas kwangchunensis TaxID=322163 RepID=A0ABP3S1L7_9CAUL